MLSKRHISRLVFFLVLLVALANLSGLSQAQDDEPYTIALERIERVKTRNGTQLRLSDLELESLPPEIGELSQLERLELSGNNLTSLPAELWELRELRHLSLSNNPLTSIPTEISNLSKLEHLTITNTAITLLPVEVWQLPHLRSLSLNSGENLRGLVCDSPVAINLSDIYINGEELAELPAEIACLQALVSLHANNLTSIPSEIGQIQSLETLYLSSSPLSHLPVEVWQLESLERLSLNSSLYLRELSPELGETSNLRDLSLRNEIANELPAEIGYLQSLEVLEARNLSSIPAEIGQLENLETFTARDGQLTTLPAEIGQLSQLTRLSVNNNQIVSIPTEIGQLHNLESLDLSNNQLHSLPIELSQLSRLRQFNFDGNPTEIPYRVQELDAYSDRRFSVTFDYLSNPILFQVKQYAYYAVIALAVLVFWLRLHRWRRYLLLASIGGLIFSHLYGAILFEIASGMGPSGMIIGFCMPPFLPLSEFGMLLGGIIGMIVAKISFRFVARKNETPIANKRDAAKKDFA